MRINVVSPTKIKLPSTSSTTNSPHAPVSMDQLIGHYMHWYSGNDTGRVIRAYG
jgi:hypothetical protein